jgi:hypothetical protein
MLTLKASLESLAAEFANGVLAAIRGASLEEILGGAGPARRGPGRPRGSTTTRRAARVSAPGRSARGGKRIRRSAKDIAGVANQIVALVAKHPKGLRGEHIRKELGIAKNHWLKPLGLALGSKKLRKTGQKRSTTYFAST